MTIRKINRSFAEAAKLLGVEISAPRHEVEKQFRIRSRQYHPDLNPNDPKASERFKELNRAHDTLISGRHENRMIASFEQETLDDVFENMFSHYSLEEQEIMRSEIEQLEREDLDEM